MLKVKWLGQAGYLLNDGKTKILIDPYLSDIVEKEEGFARLVPPPIEPSKLKADLFIATHDHMDHLDYETVSQISHECIKFAGPTSCLEDFLKLGILKENLISLNRGEKIEFGEFEIQGVLANHTEDSIGLLICHDNLKIYFTADTLWSEELGADLDPDVLFTCINGKLGNLNIDEAINLTLKVRPKLVIPNHYGMFAQNTVDPVEFINRVQSMGIKTFEHRLGKPFIIEELLQ